MRYASTVDGAGTIVSNGAAGASAIGTPMVNPLAMDTCQLICTVPPLIRWTPDERLDRYVP